MFKTKNYYKNNIEAVFDLLNDEKSINKGFGLLMELHKKYVYSIFWDKLKENNIRMTSYSNDVIEDLFDACVVKIFESLQSRNDKSGQIRGWIATVCKNHISNWKKKEGRKSSFETNDYEDDQLYDLLSDNVPKLVECVRNVLNVFKKDHPIRAKAIEMQLEKISIFDIAKVIKKTVGATKKFLHETRKEYLNFDQMRECLDYV